MREDEHKQRNSKRNHNIDIEMLLTSCKEESYGEHDPPHVARRLKERGQQEDDRATCVGETILAKEKGEFKLRLQLLDGYHWGYIKDKTPSDFRCAREVFI